MKSYQWIQQKTIACSGRTIMRGLARAVALYVFSAVAMNANASVTNTWAVDANGTWSNPANWVGPDIPTNAGDVALLTHAITAERTVTIDIPVTLGSLEMSTNKFGFVLAVSGSGSLTMNNGSDYALLKSGPGVGRNKAQISIVLESDFDLVNATTTYFDVGPFKGSKDIHVNRPAGGGILYVGGTCPDFYGNWYVYSGTLMSAGSEPFGNTSTGTRTITIYNNATLRNNGTATLYANRRIVIGTGGGTIMPNGKAMALNAPDQFAGSENMTISDTGNHGGSFTLGAANDNFTGSVIVGASVNVWNFGFGANGSLNNSPLILLAYPLSSLVVTNKPAGYDVPAGQTVAGVGKVLGKLNVTSAGAKVHPGLYTLPALVASPGTLELTNGLSMASGGAYLWDLKVLKDDDTGAAGSDFGKLNVTGGGISLSGGVVTLNFIGAAAANDPNSENEFWKSGHTWTILTGTTAPTGKLGVSNGTYSYGGFVTQVSGNNLELVYKRGLETTMIIVR